MKGAADKKRAQNVTYKKGLTLGDHNITTFKHFIGLELRTKIGDFFPERFRKFYFRLNKQT